MVIPLSAINARAAEPIISPIRAIYAYEWFPEGEHWATHFTPSLGKYDSSNPTILATHVAGMKYGGMDAAIASWWGTGSKTDLRMPLLLDAAAAQDFKVTAYYEQPTATSDAQLAADMVRLATLADHPAWLRVDGRPVLFVYNVGPNANQTAVRRYVEAASGFYVSLKVTSGYRHFPVQPDSWHQYGPARPLDSQLPHSINVSPGFWKFNEDTPRLERDVARFEADLDAMKASGVRWQLVTSLNEHGEGTGVEPTAEWQSPSGWGQYLDAMHRVFEE